MPDESLLVASPSNVRLDPDSGGTTKVPSHSGTSPSIPPGASGSNSKDERKRVFKQDIVAICNVRGCGREFFVNSRDEDLPNHHQPGARGSLKQICHGSGKRTTVFAEA